MVEALLTEVADRVETSTHEHPFDALIRFSELAPSEVRALLAHPYVRTWATACLQSGADHRFLGNIAAAAAIRTAQSMEGISVVQNGRLCLPTVGAVRVDPATELVSIAIIDGELTLHGREGAVGLGPRGVRRPTADWLPARPASSPGWAAVIEDLDPFRDCYRLPVEDYLTPDESDRWTAALAETRTIIEGEAPGHLLGLVTGLRAITPLRPGPPGSLRAATARQAYGAVGIARTEPHALAVLLVHEYQHVKLGAVLDHHDLYDPTFRTPITVGWRDDPRPVEGALQGTYAHAAVCEIWRARSGPDARSRYETYRAWTADAIEALLDSGALTPAGVGFVKHMGESLHA